MFKGCWVALVTPMHEAGGVDYTRLHELIEWQISEQVDGLVLLGTTGEAATITHPERQRILSEAVAQVRGRVPVIAGTGANSTAHSIELTEHAKTVGVDAALLVTPYYNKPTQQGLFEHYTAVADAVSLPQILYNVPVRTACDLLPETVLRLTEHPQIVGIKDATADMSRVARLADSGIDLFSGDDASALAFIKAGGHGVISVAANVMPRAVSRCCRFALQGNNAAADALDQALAALYSALFVESNPIPAKWLLQSMGKIESGIRLPLTRLADQYHQMLDETLNKTRESLKSL